MKEQVELLAENNRIMLELRKEISSHKMTLTEHGKGQEEYQQQQELQTELLKSGRQELDLLREKLATSAQGTSYVEVVIATTRDKPDERP